MLGPRQNAGQPRFQPLPFARQFESTAASAAKRFLAQSRCPSHTLAICSKDALPLTLARCASSTSGPAGVTPHSEEEGSTALRGFSAEGTEIYSNVKRVRAFGMSFLALAQGGFWASTAYMSSTAAESLLSPIWTFGGAGLSALFAGMVSVYLRRSVAKMSVHGAGASEVLVSTYAFGGFVRAPVALETKKLVGGPKGANFDERHWTFGVKEDKDAGAAYFVVDTKRGVLDESAVAAICSTAYGGESLLVLAHRRRAGEFRERWKDWEEGKGRGVGSGGSEKVD